MALDFDILLQPKQAQTLDALEATGDTAATVLGIGGSRGSAKSYDARACAIILCEKYPGIVVYIIRRVLKDLLENHMEKIRLEFPSVHKRYKAGPHEYPFPNGSRIVYVYAETRHDVDRVSYGPECTFLMVDQAEQFSEDELTSFRICNRWPAMPKGFAKAAYFFNVGKGVGAGYLRRIFHTFGYKSQENPRDYRFIQTYAWDNYEWFRGQVPYSWNQFYRLTNGQRFEMFLRDTSEGRKMNALPNHRRESELMGNFDSFSGQYFSDVWGGQCVIDADTADSLIQPWWTRWMAQRWGFGDQDCHLWAAVGMVYPPQWERAFPGSVPKEPIETIIIYREHLTQGRAESDLANDVIAMTPESERRRLRAFYLGSTALDQDSKKRGLNTVADTFSKLLRAAKLPAPLPADQNRVDGWRFVYNCLKQSEMRESPIIDHATIRQGPALFVSRACPETIENLPLATRDDKEPNDIEIRNGELWSGVADAVRFLVKAKPAPMREAPVEVRRQMLCESIKDPTSRHMAVLRFNEREKGRGKIFRSALFH